MLITAQVLRLHMHERSGCHRRWDTVHKVVWALDACVRARTVSEKHLSELQQACQLLNTAPAHAAARRVGPTGPVTGRGSSRHAVTSTAQRSAVAAKVTVSGAGSTGVARKRPRQNILDDSDDEAEGEVLTIGETVKMVRQVLDDDDDEEEEGETGGAVGAKDDESIQRSAAGTVHLCFPPSILAAADGCTCGVCPHATRSPSMHAWPDS